MNIFLSEEEEIEIPAIGDSQDRGIVVTPSYTKRTRSDLEKEIIAIDAIDNGAKAIAPIHDVNISQAGHYAAGDKMNEDVKARIMGHKYNIQDAAVAKLMATLDLLDPNDLEKPRDKIALMTGLSNLVDKISDKRDDSGSKVLHLHLHSPSQKKETDYEVIEA